MRLSLSFFRIAFRLIVFTSFSDASACLAWCRPCRSVGTGMRVCATGARPDQSSLPHYLPLRCVDCAVVLVIRRVISCFFTHVLAFIFIPSSVSSGTHTPHTHATYTHTSASFVGGGE